MNNRLFTLVVHSAHLALIAGLVFLVGQRIGTDGSAFLFRSLEQTVEIARFQLDDARDAQLHSILRQYESYVNASNKSNFNAAFEANRLCDTAATAIIHLMPGSSNLKKALSELRDSLVVLAGQESSISTQLDTDLFLKLPKGYAVDWEKFQAHARSSQQAILRAALGAQLRGIRWQVLNYFSSQMGGYDLRFDVYEPVWQPDVWCPTAGERFKTTIFLSSYTPGLNALGSKVWINGWKIPVQVGKALFTLQFDRPGPQPLNVRIELPGPPNYPDSVRVLEKTFQVNVH